MLPLESVKTLPSRFIHNIEGLSDLQRNDGSVPEDNYEAAKAYLHALLSEIPKLTDEYHCRSYGEALIADINAWLGLDLSTPPNFSHSRDCLEAPEDGHLFFFLGPLRLANGNRKGFRFETFISIREEPSSSRYIELYKAYPHPKNICQSSHLLDGSSGLTSGNNIVFFPENICGDNKLVHQQYAVFFFNKFYKIFNEITIPAIQDHILGFNISNSTINSYRECYMARCVWGYLHDYYHHQGIRPFDENIHIKTKWYTGLLEEVKVDLKTYLACCSDLNIINGREVAEFILMERLFRYPLEVDRLKNFDSGTGLFLLSYLYKHNGISVEMGGKINLHVPLFESIFSQLIIEIEKIEALSDEAYLVKARELVQAFLSVPQDDNYFTLPNWLYQSDFIQNNSQDTVVSFERNELYLSMAS